MTKWFAREFKENEGERDMSTTANPTDSTFNPTVDATTTPSSDLTSTDSSDPTATSSSDATLTVPSDATTSALSDPTSVSSPDSTADPNSDPDSASQNPLSTGVDAAPPRPYTVASWLPLVTTLAGDVPVAFVQAWNTKESGGNPCA